MSSETVKAPVDEGARKRVLIADDEPTMIRFVETLLRREGFDTLAVSDGAQVLPAVQDYTPNLIILDIMMPHLNGFEVVREIRKNPASARIPIMVCSALTDREYALASFEAGADEFLPKPFEPDTFLLGVMKLVRRPGTGEGFIDDALGQDVSDWIHGIVSYYEITLAQLRQAAGTGADTAALYEETTRFGELLRTIADSLTGDSVDLQGIRDNLEKVAAALEAKSKAVGP